MTKEQRESTEKAGERRKLFRKLVVAVTGSVGAVSEIPRFLKLLRRLIADDVVVVLSESARQFVSPYVTTIFSGNPTISEFYSAQPLLVPHVQVTKGADLLVVMPATANIIGKAANGIADDLVSATILAAECQVVFVPNMNQRMWERRAVQRNIATLRADGYEVIDPVWGTEMAYLEPTFGAMPAFSVILRRLAVITGVELQADLGRPDTEPAEA